MGAAAQLQYRCSGLTVVAVVVDNVVGDCGRRRYAGPASETAGACGQDKKHGGSTQPLVRSSEETIGIVRDTSRRTIGITYFGTGTNG